MTVITQIWTKYCNYFVLPPCYKIKIWTKVLKSTKALYNMLMEYLNKQIIYITFNFNLLWTIFFQVIIFSWAPNVQQELVVIKLVVHQHLGKVRKQTLPLHKKLFKLKRGQKLLKKVSLVVYSSGSLSLSLFLLIFFFNFDYFWNHAMLSFCDLCANILCLSKVWSSLLKMFQDFCIYYLH